MKRKPHIPRASRSPRCIRMLTAAALVALGLGAPITAQFTGKVGALTAFGTLLEIQVPGGATTLLPPPGSATSSVVGIDIVPDAANRGYAALYFIGSQTTQAFYLLQYRNGSATTLTSVSVLTSPFNAINGSLSVDQNGDYLFATGGGLFRYSQSGGLSTIAQTMLNGHTPDLRSGGWFGYSFSSILSITRAGVVTSLATLPGSGAASAIDVEPFSGDAFYTARDLWRYAAGSNSFATVAMHPGNFDFTCCEVDARSRDLIVGGLWGNLLQITPAGAVVATLFTGPPQPPLDLAGTAVEQSRELTGVGAAVAGQTYPLLVSIPGSANDAYLVGCSFGFRPGIPSPAGTIPLNPDPLFGASQAIPQMFNRFQGTLDANGEALPAIRLPNGTTGLRFYLAAIAIRGGTIAAVTKPLGVTIE